jgi:molybdopterin molybdotransferase
LEQFLSTQNAFLSIQEHFNRNRHIHLAPLSECVYCTLTEDVFSDRDYPPFHRSTMDGFALKYSDILTKEKFLSSSLIRPGEKYAPSDVENCPRINTGAAIPLEFFDTVVPIEHVHIIAESKTQIEFNIQPEFKGGVKKFQNIHHRASDTTQGTLLIPKGSRIQPSNIAICASIGKTHLSVFKPPKIAIISSGNEMVPIEKTPNEFQIRMSNVFLISTCLSSYGIQCEHFHVNDNFNEMKDLVSNCLQKFDIILTSGAVSMGTEDFLPKVFEELLIKKIFHKVAQKPGKPLWFGVSQNSKPIVGIPGNPASCAVILARYILPAMNLAQHFKLEKILCHEPSLLKANKNITQYFPVFKNNRGELYCTSFNTSGDFISLKNAIGFVEVLKEQQEDFMVYLF